MKSRRFRDIFICTLINISADLFPPQSCLGSLIDLHSTFLVQIVIVTAEVLPAFIMSLLRIDSSNKYRTEENWYDRNPLSRT